MLPLLGLVGLVGLAAAQVHTDCNPMKQDGCPANPAFGTSHLFYFNSTPSAELWETTAGVVSYDAGSGAAFTIRKQGDSPTIRTRFYFFFGRTEIWLKVAPGTGIVSSMMWLSDDLDEVDWEFLGSNTSFASTNYFGKGRQDYLNGGAHAMTGMQDAFHNYTTVWTRDQIDWYIDGARVRTLKAADANATSNYPQTPMRMGVGIWAGGDPSLPEGTRKWAGGDTDYAAGPYTMYLQKAHITDFSSGKEYSYGDRSGSWQSIKVVPGNSTALQALTRQPEMSLGEKWNALPAGARMAVYSAGAAVVALGIGGLLFYFIKQRRLGAREARLAADKAEAERHEMEQFQKTKAGGADALSEYDGHSTRRGGLTDTDSYHGPETTAASPLGDASWGAATQGPRGASPTPSAPHGFDFGVPPSPGLPPSPGVPPSPGLPRAQSPMARAQSPLLRHQSPGLPPSSPLPTPPGPPRGNYARLGSPGPQGASGGRGFADGQQGRGEGR